MDIPGLGDTFSPTIVNICSNEQRNMEETNLVEERTSNHKEKNVLPSSIIVKCNVIKLGSYHIFPVVGTDFLDVTLSDGAISFLAPLDTNETKYALITLSASEIIKMDINYGKSLPVIYVHTSRAFEKTVKSALNILPECGDIVFDPTSTDPEKNRLIFKIEELNKEQLTFLQQVFPGPEKFTDIVLQKKPFTRLPVNHEAILKEVSSKTLNSFDEINKSEKSPLEKSSTYTEDSIICLDDDSEVIPINVVSRPLNMRCGTESVLENENDFSIVYEKIVPPPDIEIVVNCCTGSKNRNKIIKRIKRKNEVREIVEIPEDTDVQNGEDKICGPSSSLDESVCILETIPTIEPKSIYISKTSDSVEKKRRIQCGICFDAPDEITKSGRNVVSTTCGHIFCCECIKQAIKNRKQCPQCRKKLTLKQFHPIYF